MIKIAPSTNPEKEEDLVKYVKLLENAAADYLHCDVMDGKFVPATCLSSDKLYEVSQNSTIPLDVHLMVENPLQVWKDYYKSKPTILTVHYESMNSKVNLLHLLTQIKSKQILVGLSIKPNTQVSEILEFLPLIDLVLIMSVEPGKSGQKFIDSTLNKIVELKAIITQNNYNIRIEVDGGIDHTNVESVYKAGADIVVMGSAVYKAEDKKVYIKKIKSLVSDIKLGL